ncbi:glyceraldehyde-3-phosphate dehydrogenase B, chloroplastic-like [Solanum stenotomum]|uniref:glyceraldehyde-3-phosphate dehydrogenase B, chloroplastic-like n=1 Tax=Solanum stenotomum TaxID=172797 RepID=UPI0020D1D254|nr:glyceraldehyde-3-phosphate dehydrogenase B, chloroplastic-like [Solanum stenotomum]
MNTTGSAGPVKGETVAKLKVAINGFGRIGRNFLRCWHGRKDSPLDVVVVNDSGGVKNASHLLKYDSMLGTFKADVKIVDNETISVDGKNIKVVSIRDPLKLPWAELGIDIVIEGTSVFVDGPGAGKHIQAGAKKVIITAPAKGADIPIYVVGVNEQDYSHEVANIVSNASCTTNCLAPFAKFLDEEFGKQQINTVENIVQIYVVLNVRLFISSETDSLPSQGIVKGTMTTTHSYTGDQVIMIYDTKGEFLKRAPYNDTE